MVVAASVALVVVMVVAWQLDRARRRLRREADRLHRLAQMDERACQAALRPRTGQVAASAYRNGSR